MSLIKEGNERALYASLNHDAIHVPYIHTVLFHQKERPLSYPVLPLNGDISLELRFDDLSETTRNYYYTIENWDSRWQNAFTDRINFADGFLQNSLSDYTLSVGTSIPYRHYHLEIPNNDIKIKRSGNYLIKVFDAADNTLVLSRRFLVFENSVDVQANVRFRSRGDMRGGSHELEIGLWLKGERVVDVFSDISLVILPNGIWQQSIQVERPEFVGNQRISYRQTVVPHNEFRTINLRELTANNPNIERMDVVKGISHVFLPPDYLRSNQRYTFSNDFNGLMMIDKFGAVEPHTEAEYFYTHFRLITPAPFLDGDVYLTGSLSSYGWDERNRLVFNPEAGGYVGSMLLKNGFYDYAYSVVVKQTGEVDMARIEGSFGQTENDYLILVYLNDIFSNTHLLKGFTIIKSKP